MLDPESAEWLRSLSWDGEPAYVRLHALLLRVAYGELARHGAGIAGPERDDLAHQAAADALVAIVRKLADFRGESRFTTWAGRFVIFEVTRKLGRHFWRAPRAPLDADLPGGDDPAQESEWLELVSALRSAVDQALDGAPVPRVRGDRAQRAPGRGDGA